MQASVMAVAEPLSPAPTASEFPSVSIVMPVRNERAHIAASVQSALQVDYDPAKLELLAVDGMSDDGTRDLLADLAARHDRLRVLDNPERGQAAALNRGITAARGDVVVRMDAHAIYPPDYVRRCVDRLLTSGADNVGGVCVTVPAADTPVARAIAKALSHPFGVGDARFRIGANSPCWVDSVPFGCWWRTTLRDLGGFDTDLPHAEDDELNARLIRGGGRVLLDPAIAARYVARATLGQLVLMLFQYGYSKPFAAHRVGRVGTMRQLAPPAYVLTLGASLALGTRWPIALAAGAGAIVAHLFVGCFLAFREARTIGPAAATWLPVTFTSMHLAYGWGYLRGTADLLLRGSARRPRRLSR